MQKHLSSIRINLVSVALTMAFSATFVGLSQVPRQKQQPSTPAPDFSRFPIVDFTFPGSVNPELKAAREAKGRKYGMKGVSPISEQSDKIFSAVDWERHLTALPIEQSSAVVIGTVIGAAAHLSPDKTAIYSEFQINPDTVVRNDAANEVRVGLPLIVERTGGRVRLPSGKIVVSWVRNQNMPETGKRYLLFLTHSFQSRDDAPKDFNILTGYELRNGLVFPLDDIHPFTTYRGTAESAFLNDLLKLN